MPQPIRVDPKELNDAAERVRSHAEQLLAGHGSAISTADAAQPGLIGQSAQAIAATTHRWQATTAELQRVLASQADALASAANAYAQTEENNRRAVTSLDPVDP
jgi:WXG100 family type VII secretion target